MIDCFLGYALGLLSCQFWSTVPPFGVWLLVHTLDYWIVAVDLWQYYVCCTRSGVTRCTLFMVLFLCRMCRCGLHAVLLSHIGTLMRLLAAEPLSIARHLFPGQCLCGTILVTPCLMVWDWRVLRAGSMPFYWPSCSLTFCLLLFSLSLLSFDNWCCGVGVFGLIVY